MEANRRIADLEDVPTDDTVLFTVREGFDEREAILIRDEGEDGGTVHAWLNYCQHWIDVRLDKGSGAPVRDGEIVCRKHGATFERDTGTCTFGPCEGADLTPVDVTVSDGGVYLTDDDYEFVRRGASSEVDRSSRGGLGF